MDVTPSSPPGACPGRGARPGRRARRPVPLHLLDLGYADARRARVHRVRPRWRCSPTRTPRSHPGDVRRAQGLVRVRRRRDVRRRTLIVRPTYVSGPTTPPAASPTGPPARRGRGGPRSGPAGPAGAGDRRARPGDLVVRLLEDGASGPFHVAGPPPPYSLGDLLEAIREAVAPEGTTIRWIDPKTAREDAASTGRPCRCGTKGARAPPGRPTPRAALARGLRMRPVADSARDTLQARDVTPLVPAWGSTGRGRRSCCGRGRAGRADRVAGAAEPLTPARAPRRAPAGLGRRMAAGTPAARGRQPPQRRARLGRAGHAGHGRRDRPPEGCGRGRARPRRGRREVRPGRRPRRPAPRAPGPDRTPRHRRAGRLPLVDLARAAAGRRHLGPVRRPAGAAVAPAVRRRGARRPRRRQATSPGWG